MKQRPSFCALFLVCALVSGCASTYEPSGYFASYSLLEPGPYFKQEFVEPMANFEKYKKIMLRPVNMEYFDREAEYKLGPGDKETLRFLLEEELKIALARKYKLVPTDAPQDQETLIVAPALTYARAPSRLINLVSSLLIFVPLTSGSAALEVKLLDASTGKVVAQVAEKRTGSGEMKSIFIGPFMKFVHAQAIFKKWSEKLAAFISSQKFMAVPVHG